jgi:hypothetical protein
MTDPLRNLVGDEWRISIAEQILLIEGPAH